MSLKKVEVERAKNILKNMMVSTEQLLNIRDIKKLIDENDEFLSFIYGTSVGLEMYEELEEMIELVVGNLYANLDSMNNHTLEYLNRIDK